MMAFAWRNKAVLLWALGLLAAVGVIARSSFTTDMGAFLPQNPSNDFIDGITYDGRKPNAYLTSFKIGLTQ